MHIAAIRDLAAKVSILLVLSIALLWASFTTSQAQKAFAPPPPGKIEELIKLLDDPEIKAWITTKNNPPPAAEVPDTPTATNFMVWSNAIRAHLRGIVQAIPAVPAEFSQARSTIMTEINGRRPGAILVLFAAFAGLGFGAEFAFRRILGRGRRPMAESPEIEGSHARHRVIGRSIFTAIAPLVVFAFVSVGVFHALTWPPLLAMLVLPMLVALIAWRVIMQMTAILLGTDRSRVNDSGEVLARLIPMDDTGAAFWYRRVAFFAGIFFTGWTVAAMMTALNFTPNVKSLILYIFGVGLLAVALETVWNRPKAPIASRVYRVKEWLLTCYLCLLWLLWVAGTGGALWVGIYVLILPPILRTTSTIVKSFFSGPDDTTVKPGNPVLEVLIERTARVVIIALAAAWLAAVVRFRAIGLMEDEAASRMIRGVLGGVVILLAADLIWHMVKGFINQRIERARIEGGDEAALARSGRLMTLLPILRNFLAVAIAAIAVMMVLSGLGVAIGPLIAGAGIFGVAIGFGSQSLVKDIISGIFYMTDDAFRVGEYIQSGSYMGTVESFGIRSVKLRHHRGPIFTIPFGTLGAVQNMSRDWVIDKFFISVNFDVDLVKIKKLVKGVGAELLEDEELGPYIIETVKMKGVEAFSDYGIKLSFAVMTKPGHQSAIRRRAYAMIREAFALNGIGFASPTVQVAGGEDHAAGAVAAASDTITRKKAAEAKLKLVEGES
ncbi:mechanosensitive ion channel family protein [Candidatus Phyllobacterium onerii]|uniref:mechanosensitive ion channel family protein n=1 Tax=Candidatus Phyllobacterium onerii TaxID=3020828 RepID=UPI0023301D9F|nr:mechanosensitive ion channel family protein [Phyllobacterium sp. IY22]